MVKTSPVSAEAIFILLAHAGNTELNRIIYRSVGYLSLSLLSADSVQRAAAVQTLQEEAHRVHILLQAQARPQG